MAAGPTVDARSPRAADARPIAERLARSRVLWSPTVVATAVTVVYAALALVILTQRPAVDFAFVGRMFVSGSETSPTIAKYAHGTLKYGYDGQFALYIALDPAHAVPSMDDKPVYRYSHILYPVLGRAVALGNDDWVAAALIVVNLLAIFFGTLALGLIMRRHRVSPVLAMFFGLFAGVFVTFNRDLGDTLGYSLVALGLLALRWDSRSRIVLAGVAFAAAALSRETTLIFPAILCLFELTRGDRGRWQGRLARTASLGALAVLPYAAWRMFLVSWLGANGNVPSGLAPYPFAGVVTPGQPVAVTVTNIVTIVAPALLLALVILGSGLWKHRSGYPAIVLVQVLVLVVFLPTVSYQAYFSAGRLQIGTVVATVCCAPFLRTISRRYRQVLGIAIVLAMAPSLEFVLIMLSGKPV
jgi:hypothetical protein